MSNNLDEAIARRAMVQDAIQNNMGNLEGARGCFITFRCVRVTVDYKD